MRKRSLAGLTLLVLAAVAVIPSLGRTIVFPGLHGFQEIAPHLWVERGSGDFPVVPEQVVEAEAKIAAFWGRAPDRPRILVCRTEVCDARLGGPGSLAQAYGRHVIVVFSRLSQEPEDVRQAILAHELSHTALAARISTWRLIIDDIPAWLNEGLAVLAADDPRYDLTEALCARLRDETLPEARRDWGRQAGQGARPLYQAAACQAQVWLESNALDAL